MRSKGKKKKYRKDIFMRVCEQCGNEMFSPKTTYQCRFCGWWNGVKKR